MPENKRTVKEKVGSVVSDKMDKTIVVKVAHRIVHPIFKKTIKRFNRFKAHDSKNSAKLGDTVKIRESRPISKNKSWKLVNIIEKAK